MTQNQAPFQYKINSPVFEQLAKFRAETISNVIQSVTPTLSIWEDQKKQLFQNIYNDPGYKSAIQAMESASATAALVSMRTQLINAYTQPLLDQINKNITSSLQIELPNDFIKNALVSINLQLENGTISPEIVEEAEAYSENVPLASRQLSATGRKALNYTYAVTSEKVLLYMLSFVLVLGVIGPIPMANIVNIFYGVVFDGVILEGIKKKSKEED